MATKLLGTLPRGLTAFLGSASLIGAGVATQGFTPAVYAEEAKKETALDPKEWRSFKLAKKVTVATNEETNVSSVWLRFSLDSPDQKLGLPVASCFVTRAPIGEEQEDGSRKAVIRPYTPVTTPEWPEPVGVFDLVIKRYPNGLMSKHIADLEVGQSLEVKGPIPKFPYKANMKKKIGMIAGGSGLTPMMQVASQILSNPEDKTEVSFIYANQTAEDIIFKDDLDQMQEQHSNFKVHYVLDKPGKDWTGLKGFVDEKMVKDVLPPPADDNWILVCGPPPMMKALSGDKAKDKSQGELSGVLKAMGYTAEQVYKF